MLNSGFGAVAVSDEGPDTGAATEAVIAEGPATGDLTLAAIDPGPTTGDLTLEAKELGPAVGGGGGGAPQSKLNTPVFVGSSHTKSRWLSVIRLASKTIGLGAEVRCKGSRVLASVPHVVFRGIAKITEQREPYLLNLRDRNRLDF